MQEEANIYDYIKLHSVILVWGFTGILGKLITIPSTSIVFYRTLFACISLVAYLLIRKRSLRVDATKTKNYLLTGIVVALHWVFFFEALKVSTVSVTLATLASATLFTSILEPIFFKKKVVLYEMLFGLLVIAGLILIFSFETKYALGITYSLISAFCASLFTTLNGTYVAKGGDGTRISMYEMLGAMVIVMIYMISTGGVNFQNFSLGVPGTDMNLNILYLLILGVLCTAIAFVISVDVMKRLTPYTVSISINMEPIYSIILALLFFGEKEQMSIGFYAGALLIMSTIYANGIMKKKTK